MARDAVAAGVHRGVHRRDHGGERRARVQEVDTGDVSRRDHLGAGGAGVPRGRSLAVLRDHRGEAQPDGVRRGVFVPTLRHDVHQHHAQAQRVQQAAVVPGGERVQLPELLLDHRVDRLLALAHSGQPDHGGAHGRGDQQPRARVRRVRVHVLRQHRRRRQRGWSVFTLRRLDHAHGVAERESTAGGVPGSTGARGGELARPRVLNEQADQGCSPAEGRGRSRRGAPPRRRRGDSALCRHRVHDGVLPLVRALTPGARHDDRARHAQGVRVVAGTRAG